MNIMRMITMQRDFMAIEKFFNRLKSGELDEIKDVEESERKGHDVWKIVQKNESDEFFDLLGSLAWWCEFFRELAKMYLPDYDDKPIQKLISKLRLEQLINDDIIREAEAVVSVQRKLYLGAKREHIEAVRTKVFEMQESA